MEICKKYNELSHTIKDILKDGNVFFSENYNHYIENTGGYIWYVYDEIFVLPVVVTEKIKIKQGLYISEPFCMIKDYETRQLACFLNETSAILKEKGIAWISTSAAALFNAYPDKSLRIPFGSHVIDLSLSEEELLMKMHSKHRNSVRRAERNGVVVKSGGKELIPDYIKADEETWERSDRDTYGSEFFEKIIDCMGDKAIIYMAYKDDKPQTGACFFVNQRMSYYMYGASITNPEPGSANLLQWTAIKDMKAAGVERFSFVGCRINEDEDSKYHGIQRFKERFGGELIQGYMFKSVLNPIKTNIFDQLYKIKNGNTIKNAIDQEIYKWPELQKIKAGE